MTTESSVYTLTNQALNLILTLTLLLNSTQYLTKFCHIDIGIQRNLYETTLLRCFHYFSVVIVTLLSWHWRRLECSWSGSSVGRLSTSVFVIVIVKSLASARIHQLSSAVYSRNKYFCAACHDYWTARDVNYRHSVKLCDFCNKFRDFFFVFFFLPLVIRRIDDSCTVKCPVPFSLRSHSLATETCTNTCA